MSHTPSHKQPYLPPLISRHRKKHSCHKIIIPIRNNHTTTGKTKRNTQTTLNGYVVLPYGNDDAYGAPLPKKPSQTLRLTFQNINGISKSHWMPKSKEILRKTKELQSDVAGFAEMNLNGHKAAHIDQWKQRVTAAFPAKSKSTHCYNTTEHFQTDHVHGGVGMIATEEANVRYHAQDDDPTGLGRWTSLLFRGKRGHRLRVITAYNPVAGACKNSVMEQHRRYFRRNLDNTDPGIKFQEDLERAIKTWITAGELIVLMLDANQDIREGPLRTMLLNSGLREMILSQNTACGPAPATYARNESNTPIDGIFSNLPSDIQYKCGYLGFGEGVPGDHRMAWIDIPYFQAFGHTPPHLYATQPVRLTTTDPRVVALYHKRVKIEFEKHGVYQLVSTITQMVRNKKRARRNKRRAISQKIEALYNKLSFLNRAIRKRVEQKLRKLRMGDMAYSEAGQDAKDQYELWINVLKLHNKVRVSRRMIQRQMKSLGVKHAFDVPVMEVKRRIAHYKAEYYKIKKNPAKHRESWLETLAKAIAKDKDKPKALILKNLRHREKQRNEARRCRAITGKGADRARTTKMFYTTTDPLTHVSRRVECDTQDSMGAAGAAENEARMSRSIDSAFMQEPLYSDFGDLADTPETAKVLNGSYVPPPGCNPFAEILLRECSIPHNVTPLEPDDLDWTPEELEKAWSKQRINTSAEPTGLSFPHLMVGALDPTIAAIDTLLHNLPFTHGFSPKSWQIITDVAILKKAGVYDVELMRTIMLMDSYYNMNNKRLGRLIMQQAEAHDMIPHDQYGGRKGHRSDNQALNKQLIFDIYRLKRWAAAVEPMDASQCYDRMNHNITTVAVMSTGIPKEPVISRFKTMQKALHYISTAFGISKHTHGGVQREKKGLKPEQGAGQGGGSAPGEFTIISAKLIQVLRRYGLTMLFIGAISLRLTIIAALMFVDDAVPGVSAHSELQSGEDVLPRAQAQMDMWEGCLSATGGAINWRKSCWYLLDYVYDPAKAAWRYRTIADMPGELMVNDKDGERKALTRLEADQTAKYLGIWPTPNGSSTRQQQYLKELTTAFADKVRSRSGHKNDVWIALVTTIMKSLAYPMRAINLDQDQWKDVMKPIHQTVIPRASFSRTFPRAIMYGPTKFQGMALEDPWTANHLRHAEVLWESFVKDDLTGKLMHAEMEEILLALGTGGEITDHKFSQWSHCITNCWQKDLWEFCENHHLTFSTDTPKLQLHRQNDQFIMRALAQNGYSARDLSLLNQCRTWLNVITLSDITSPDGRTLNPETLNRTKVEPHLHRYQWPRQPHELSTTLWNKWTEAITLCFLDPASTILSLRTPLGDWIEDPMTKWPWIYHPSTNILYHREGDFIKAFATTGSSRRATFHPLPTLYPAISQGAYTLAHIRRTASGIELARHSPIRLHQTDPPPSIDTVLEGVQALPPSLQWTIGDFMTTDNGAAIAQAIEENKAIAVSDGSFKDGVSTAGFILEGNNSSRRIEGQNHVPGPTTEQSSHRGELGGILGILVITRILCQIHEVDSGSIIIGLDNDSALKSSESPWDPKIQQTDFDLIAEIRATIRELPLNVSFKWVQGHQDRNDKQNSHPANPPIDQHSRRQYHGRLDRWAKLNIRCDELAKAYWARDHQTFIPLRRLPHAPFALLHKGLALPRYRHKDMYTTAREHVSKAHWKHRHEHVNAIIPAMPDDAWDSIWNDINWEAQGTAFRGLPHGKQRWLTKHATGHCGVGRMLQRRKWQQHSCCPLCDSPDEDTIHVIKCRDPRATALWEKMLDDLKRWMQANNTCPRLTLAIIYHLQQWRHPKRRHIPSMTQAIRLAMKDQSTIGWWGFLLGRITKSLLPIQQKYMEKAKTRSNCHSWSSRLIPRIWDISFFLWQHRCDILHGPALTPKQHQHLEKLRQQVIQQVIKGTATLPSTDHWRLTQEQAASAMSSDIENTQLWLESIQLARDVWRRETEERANQMARQQRALREYFVHGRFQTNRERSLETSRLRQALADNQ